MVYRRIQQARSDNRPMFALLIDPDRHTPESLVSSANAAVGAGVDLLLLGSSILLENGTAEAAKSIKSVCDLPVVLFPGHGMQVTNEAHALLFLSLISGRNPDLLIGQHVHVAPSIKRSGLETIPTGYMLIDSGAPTSASYMSQSAPIPHDKDDIAAATAMAGELLGMKTSYLDAGSGARFAVRESMIAKVRTSVNLPLIVGGGLRSAEQVSRACEAGADMVVVGNSVEKDPDSLFDLTAPIRASYR
ncbi:MAG: geranylgeranylglyceryl/heptaprenylglyceryl phosphate synthase [Bacteroidota bacterium]